MASTDVETGRLSRAVNANPHVVELAAGRPNTVAGARALYRQAAAAVQSGAVDDRPLYWSRLAMLQALRGDKHRAAVEAASRGFDGVGLNGQDVLVTGFDPFGLDRDIGQSNPSGAVALALHGTRVGGRRVGAAILPVRFQDFDDGVVERLLAPVFRRRPALVVTVSMGRDAVDLERFPARRRSSEAPDNQGVQGGGSEPEPLPPPGVAGPEFLEFSLPAAAMTAVEGRWPVRDNRRVATRERGEFAADSLAELAGQTSVQGSSGGFLSNEIAYRSLLLQRTLGLSFPLGHIHTPTLVGYDSKLLSDVVAQVRELVRAALVAIR